MSEIPKTHSLAFLKNSILTQAKALEKLAEDLDDNCLKVVALIEKLKGRVVICGMGKSGHIARKVAATMSSTGTPALFLHPSESLHGDLGMVTSSDLVLFISKSGENPELNLMLPSLHRMEVPIVAVTCNPESSLAKLADYLLPLGEVEEICHLNLAPTTSTTLSMVLLDAIAVELMRRKNFKVEQYALFHPGGRLGRRLIFQVQDLMSPPEKTPCIGVSANAKEMLSEITRGMMGAVLVVDEKQQLLGLITDHDIRCTLEKQETFFSCPIASIMNPSPMTCNPLDLSLIHI